MTDIDRYDVYAFHDAWGGEDGDYGAYSWTEAETTIDGEWVKAEDALALLARVNLLEKEVEKLRKENSNYGWIVNPDSMGG